MQGACPSRPQSGCCLREERQRHRQFAWYRLCVEAGAKLWDDAAVFDGPRDALYLLQRWYVAQCNGEWEHSYGIEIGTLDNPGWSLRVDLKDTTNLNEAILAFLALAAPRSNV
jgi:hypothetical protein